MEKECLVDRIMKPWLAFWLIILVFIVAFATTLVYGIVGRRQMPTISCSPNDTCYSYIGFMPEYESGEFYADVRNKTIPIALVEGEIIAKSKKDKYWKHYTLHNGVKKVTLIKNDSILDSLAKSYSNTLVTFTKNYKFDENKRYPTSFWGWVYWNIGTCWSYAYHYEYPLMAAKTNKERLEGIYFRNYGRTFK